tara:strand:- start:2357 stop:2806 length:450 start_codon:yes stop_codon:yes gene_type:complete
VKKGLKVLQLKNSIFIIALVLFFFACSKNNTEDNISIIGKWQLIEYCEDNGGGTLGCVDVENGLVYNFNDNGTFSVSSTLSTCLNGTFTNNTTYIFLEYSNNENCSLSDDVYILDYIFIDEKLKLEASVENQNCDEECFGRYKNITIEE